MKFPLENRSSDLSMADLSSITKKFTAGETAEFVMSDPIPDNAVYMIFEMDRPIDANDPIYYESPEVFTVDILFSRNGKKWNSYSGFSNTNGLDKRILDDRTGQPFEINYAIMRYAHPLPPEIGRHFKFTIASPNGHRYRLPRVYFEKS